MTDWKIRRAYQIARTEGLGELGGSAVNYTLSHLLPKPTRVRLRAIRYRLAGHPGVGDPLRVYRVPVSELNHCINNSRFSATTDGFTITDGTWDSEAFPIEEFPLYRMFEKHFEHGIPWEETDRFERRERYLDEHGSFSELDLPPEQQSIDAYREYLAYFDSLYEDIRENGYKTQRELATDADFMNREREHPAFGEIEVLIGRDGQLIARGGLHRTCIARILDLETVPVRTLVRHTRWQAVRDELATVTRAELSKRSRQHLAHPEVQDLVCESGARLNC